MMNRGLVPMTGLTDSQPAGDRVSDAGIPGVLDTDPAKTKGARAARCDAEAACTKALLLDRQGRTGEALAVRRSLFGELFPAP
jgi:hypothetical protein